MIGRMITRFWEVNIFYTPGGVSGKYGLELTRTWHMGGLVLLPEQLFLKGRADRKHYMLGICQ